MFCFFPVHGEGEGEREGEVRAWYDRRSLSVRSDAKTVNGMRENGDAILSAKDKTDFGRPGPFKFFPFVKHKQRNPTVAPPLELVKTLPVLPTKRSFSPSAEDAR